MKKLSESAMKVLKYRYLQEGETPDDMFWRVANTISSIEDEGLVREWSNKFYEVMSNLDFLPNTPCLINAGRNTNQLSACFVVPIEDSIESIFNALKHTALIHKSGGGTGFDFSKIRPRGSIVGISKGVAGGPVSFMKIFNTSSQELKQGGVREGANMGILRVDHPDILEFIDCKNKEGELSNFNISVAITDEFMSALNEKKFFDLKFNGEVKEKINSKDIWDKIIEGSWKNGEPGVIFIDTINRLNPLKDYETIDATNPCSELPLPAWGSCGLGSINLSNFVIEEETGYMEGEIKIDYKRLKEVVEIGVRFLDNVIDINSYPLFDIKQEAKSKRRIGLGIMGLADLFSKMKIKYGSKESFKLADQIMGFIQDKAFNYSTELGKEKGFTWIDEEEEIDSRNGCLTTIAPAGSLSLIAGCSSGCEPVFSFKYDKKCIDGEIEVVHPLVEKYWNHNLQDRSAKALPDYFITANQVSIENHIKMQATLQKNIDAGISKTINALNETTIEQVSDAFKMAYESGCKSVTFYREGSREVEALVSKNKKIFGPNEIIELVEDSKYHRPQELKGVTKRISTGRGRLYVTMNEHKDKVIEVFLNLGKSGKEDFAYSEAIGRLISIALRSGVSLEKIVEHLNGISGHAPVWSHGQLVKSVPDAIAKVLEGSYDKDTFRKYKLEERKTIQLCPDCGSEVVFEEGCKKCYNCGWGKCDG